MPAAPAHPAEPGSCSFSEARSSSRSIAIGRRPKPVAVGVGGVGPDPDRMLEGRRHGRLHGLVVAGVAATGDERRRHQREERALHLDPLASVASPTSALRSMVRLGDTWSAGLEVIHDDAVAVHHALGCGASARVPRR